MKETINRVLIKCTDLTKNVNCKGILCYHQFRLVVYNGMETNFHICPTFPDYASVSNNIQVYSFMERTANCGWVHACSHEDEKSHDS